MMPRKPLDKTPDNWRSAGRKRGEVTAVMSRMTVGESFIDDCKPQSAHTRAKRLGIKISARKLGRGITERGNPHRFIVIRRVG